MPLDAAPSASRPVRRPSSRAQPPVIGLAGPIGAGKTLAAKLLRRHLRFQLVPFAGPLKDMLAALGVPDENLHGTPEQKAAPLPLLGGRSARHAMQTLGTEWGRRMISADLWVAAWRARVEALGCGVVADDVRFPDEAAAIHALGGIVIGLTRPGVGCEPSAGSHESERCAFDVDIEIQNDADGPALYRRIRAALANEGLIRPAAR